MKIKALRKYFSVKSTISEIFIDENPAREMFWLEDVCRPVGVKIPKETAIPAGPYKVRITMSTRFKKLMPLIYNQPDFTVKDSKGKVWAGIRIHAGLHKDHTEGCPLTGKSMANDMMIDSPEAYESFYNKLYAAIGTTGEAELEIINQQID